jgi:hypothetical protein
MSNQITYAQYVDTVGSSILLTLDPPTNGEEALLSVEYTSLAHELPIKGSVQIKTPNQNLNYEAIGDNSRNGMFKTSPTPSIATAIAYAGPGKTGAVINMGTVTLTYTDERSVTVFMNNSVVVPAGGYLKVQAGKVKNPACTKPFGGF